jgi:hypothetical protein
MGHSTQQRAERIEHIFRFMEYGELTDRQHELIISFEEQWKRYGRLSERQMEILEDIFKQAAERA